VHNRVKFDKQIKKSRAVNDKKNYNRNENISKRKRKQVTIRKRKQVIREANTHMNNLYSPEI